jgi:hypothetical protein
MSEGTTPTESRREASSSTQPARDVAVAALGRLESGQRDALEELRVALCAYVGVLGREGWTGDAVLSHVRELMMTPATPAGAVSLTPIVREALTELTLEWCRAEYARLTAR